MKKDETFKCKSCGHDLPIDFQMRTNEYCYLCDPNVTVTELLLEQGEYYRINGTNKILYWDGTTWMKPVKDQQKRYGTWNQRLEKQPRIKSVKRVNISDLK